MPGGIIPDIRCCFVFDGLGTILGTPCISQYFRASYSSENALPRCDDCLPFGGVSTNIRACHLIFGKKEVDFLLQPFVVAI